MISWQSLLLGHRFHLSWWPDWIANISVNATGTASGDIGVDCLLSPWVLLLAMFRVPPLPEFLSLMFLLLPLLPLLASPIWPLIWMDLSLRSPAHQLPLDLHPHTFTMPADCKRALCGVCRSVVSAWAGTEAAESKPCMYSHPCICPNLPLNFTYKTSQEMKWLKILRQQ